MPSAVPAPCWSLTEKLIQRVEVEAVVADAKIVEQVRLQRVGIGEERVLVHPRLRHAGRRNRPDRRIEAVVPVVAHIQADLVADVLIDPSEELIDVVLVRRRRRQIVGGAGGVRRRVVLQQVHRHRRQHRLRDDVARKRLAGERVLDRGADLREIALAHQRGRDRAERRAERFRAHAFVGAHEECLVVAVIETRDHHRPIGLEPELIAAQRILRIRRVLDTSRAN